MASSKNLLMLPNLLRKFSPFSVISPCLGNQVIIRHSSKKHVIQKWRWHRKMKVIKVDLPDFHKKEDESKMSSEEVRSKMRERGIDPPRFWRERPFCITSTSAVYEPYVPPEGDGKVAMMSKEGAKQTYDLVSRKGKGYLAIKKIRSYDEDFETDEFVTLAQDIYQKAHEALLTKDPEQLLPYVTERGIAEMMNNVKNRTIRWKLIGSIEPPRIVHARQIPLITQDNLFAQLTVRFHTQQMLAVYDRFGRLIYGSEIVAKDVLEYVVFEKQLSNVYGQWRILDKIIPDWMPKPDPPPFTYRARPMPQPEDIETAETQVVQPDDGQTVEKTDDRPTPAIA